MQTSPFAVQDEAAPQSAAAGLPRRDNSFSDWILVAGGICVAGGAYPILCFLFLAGVEAVSAGMRALYGFPTASEMLDMLALLLGGAFFSVIAGVVGVIWTSVVTLLVMPVFYLFVRSMQLRASLAWLGANLGGLVGFVAILPLLLTTQPPLFGGNPWEVLLVLALGPCLTTVLGQAGGAWGGWHAESSASHVAWSDALAAAGGWRAEPVPNGSAALKKPLFQFRIRHLLWLTLWLGVFLAAMAATGFPFVILAIFGVWLVFQAATLYLGSKLLRRIARWRVARRQRRCT